MSGSQTDNNPEPIKEPSLLPFPPGKLTTAHKKEVIRIRTTLISWLLANADEDETVSSPNSALEKATNELSELKVDMPYAFTPSPPYKFRPVLLSCIKCYWMALIETLDAAEKEELSMRLGLVPPYGNRIPRFDGKKCVEKPTELNAREYEGLMRVTTMVIVNLASNDIVKMWRELAEVGVQTWEETD